MLIEGSFKLLYFIEEDAPDDVPHHGLGEADQRSEVISDTSHFSVTTLYAKTNAAPKVSSRRADGTHVGASLGVS
ncbi:hypothetical protein EYF80_049259 [Liparis tanakae]|uniref:Uncharacterized protein n=1 Tax=Liparis tanakae TaxID=230148 RepID=A0A4Z2FH91_9TELE|nr:hypothetical protein EYF80_049259 [Liparis tanakae]